MPKTDDAPDQIIRVRVYLAASWHEASVLRDMRAAISSIPTAQLVDTEPTEWIDAEASGALNTPETRDECLDVVASIVKALRRSDAVIVWNGRTVQPWRHARGTRHGHHPRQADHRGGRAGQPLPVRCCRRSSARRHG